MKRVDGILWPDNCVIFKGTLSRTGYGVVRVGIKSNYSFVHRLTHEIFNDHIPKDMVIDHLCRNRNCINPKHLRSVTQAQNTLENSMGPAALNKRKTHCKNAHEFTDKNTRVYKNHRHCRECHRLYEIKRRALWK